MLIEQHDFPLNDTLLVQLRCILLPRVLAGAFANRDSVSVWSVWRPLLSRELPQLGQAEKGTAGRTPPPYITVLLNGKYTPGLIFKRGKSAIVKLYG